MLTQAAENIGKGLVAGAVGTAAMTLSSTLEAKARNRGASTAPATAASSVLGVKPVDSDAESRFNNLVHWGYGTGLGAVRGLISTTGLGPAGATAAHLGTVWGAEQAVLPATGAAPPITEWGPKEIAIDLLHHAVYVAGAAAAWAWLERS